MFTRSVFTLLTVALAIVLAGAGLAVAAAAGVVRPNDPTPRQHHVPLIVYGQAS